MAGITKYSGVGGAIKIASTKIASIENWKLSVKGNTVDVTSFDSEGWEEYLATTKGWEVSCEGTLAKGDAQGQDLVLKALVDGTTLAVTLEKATGDAFSGNVLVESVEIDTSVKDKIKLSIKAKGTGKLTGFGSLPA